MMNRSVQCWCRIAMALGLAGSAAHAQPAGSLDGVWVTDGYGIVLRVRGDAVEAFELTAVSCIPSMGAHRVQSDTPGVVFQADSDPTTFRVLPGTSAETRRFHEDGAASDKIIHRIASLPAGCTRAVPDDPVTNFDIFWQTYREQYPFFALRRVDWDATRRQFRPRATGASPAQLFGILRTMIEPLHDAHTYLGAPDPSLRYHGERPDSNPFGAAERDRALQIITTNYLRTPLHQFARGWVRFGMLRDSIAYLRLTSFCCYVKDSGYTADRRVLDAALDTVFASTSGWRGLVIDVRVNGGGADPLGLAIASRLATAPYLAYAKVARRDTANPTVMTDPQQSIVVPSTRPGWRGPVVELIGLHSVSAAETFTQALMGRQPAIPRIGENTQGVFSDILGRRLPNGWRFGLPNELFLTAEGTSFDGGGIPPTIPVPTFASADLAGGRDPGLERAIAVIEGQGIR
jgi:hypothetical protein